MKVIQVKPTYSAETATMAKMARAMRMAAFIVLVVVVVEPRLLALWSVAGVYILVE